jgi:hypothetical protein
MPARYERIQSTHEVGLVPVLTLATQQQDANYTVLTGEDFTIHDTVSYDNTTPVAERIPRLRKVLLPLRY